MIDINHNDVVRFQEMFSCLFAPSFQVTGLACDSWTNPLGGDRATSALSWELRGGVRGDRQTVYQVLVASSPELFLKNQGDLLDSGKIEGRISRWIDKAGCSNSSSRFDATVDVLRVQDTKEKQGETVSRKQIFDLTSKVEMVIHRLNRMIGDESYPDDCTPNQSWASGVINQWASWLISKRPRPESRRVTFVALKQWKKGESLLPSEMMRPGILNPYEEISLD